MKKTKFGIQFFAQPGGVDARLDAIDARLAAISQELDKPGADLDALEQEVRNLKQEKTQITQGAERRANIMRMMSAGEGTVVRTFDPGLPEKRTYTPESAEYRSAWLRNLQGKTLTAEERAAVTASAVIPTQTMNRIVGKLEETPIIAAVDVTYIPGNVSYPVEKTVNAASWVAMGTAATDSGDALDTISLGAYKLIKTVEITADVKDMGIDAFESWLVDRLANKIAVAVDAAIFNGTGSSQATGILKAGEITQTGTFTKTAITFKDLTKIMATVGTQYLTNAKFAMPRALFYGEVLGLTDTAGKPVVVTDPQSPAKLNILGFPVIVDDNCAADTIVFGDFKEGYKFNFAKAPVVESDASVAFRAGSTVYRAMALADGKPADKKALCVFKRASA